jgi:hypothetical protein
MYEERPIVFTVTPLKNFGEYWIRTKDDRSEEPYRSIYCGELSNKMIELSEKYNNKGYAVLFEVD